MLLDKNYDNTFEFVEVIIQNIVISFSGHGEKGIVDDVRIT